MKTSLLIMNQYAVKFGGIYHIPSENKSGVDTVEIIFSFKDMLFCLCYISFVIAPFKEVTMWKYQINFLTTKVGQYHFTFSSFSLTNVPWSLAKWKI